MNPDPRQTAIRNLLVQIVESTDALAAVAWDCNSLPYQELDYYSPDTTGAMQLAFSPQEHLQLIQGVAESARPQIAVAAGDKRAESSSESVKGPVIALIPLEDNGRGKLVLEAFLHPDVEKSHYEHCLATVVGLLNSGSASSESERLQNVRLMGNSSIGSEDLPFRPSGTTSEAAVAEYCDLIHRSIEKKESAARIANETRRLLQCDRVSVMHFNNNRSKIVAISGQQSVNRRSNSVRLLEQLAKRVLRLKKEFIYPVDGDSIAPQIEGPLNDYLKVAVARCVCIIPLFEKTVEETADTTERPKVPNLIGGLIIEHFTEEWELAESLTLVRLAADHASNAYANAIRHESLWLYPLWNLLGKSRFLTAPRRLPITLLVLASILILTLSLILIPWEFKVVSDGYLIPEKIEYVYAPFDGEVIEVVEGGAVLPLNDNPIRGGNSNSVAKLLNLDLNEKVNRVEGQLREAEKELYQLNRSFQFERESNSTARSEGQIRVQIESLKRQLEILRSQSNKLIIDSEIDGTVLTHSTTERLKNRPFKRGDKLLEIADTDGDWIVELKMPDNRIGHVLNAQQEIGDLRVTCILATDPSKSFTGKVLDVAQSTEVSQEDGQTVTIRVEIDPDTDPSFLHARSQVVGKVHCGRRSLGYVWFHQVGEYLQKNVWFRIW